MRNEEELRRVKQEWNIVHTIKKMKVDSIGMNCRLKHVIQGKTEGNIEVTGRQGRRHKQPLDDLE